jgi:hypothetical protein
MSKIMKKIVLTTCTLILIYPTLVILSPPVPIIIIIDLIFIWFLTILCFIEIWRC